MIHTNKTLTEIASEYMFDSYDTFTRAFKREVKITPSGFRKKAYKVGRRRLVMGMNAPVKDEDTSFLATNILEVEKIMKNIEKTENSCILYGVPKVAYTFEECTPFAVALKACLNYMGQNMDYAYIMATTGAAFRLRWNTEFWDGGNVDIMTIYEDRFEPFKRAFEAAGRSYEILEREKVDKSRFIHFIKSEIDEGRPVIALGIIGPPEACVITGYKDNGETLLGWNCFQENREFRKEIDIDESGYFVSKNWWENKATIAIMSIGEEQHPLLSHKEILDNAINIMTKEKVCVNNLNGKEINEYTGGQLAYDAWARALSDDNEFPKDAILPILMERVMCQNDAQAMIGEGRSYAVIFIEKVGKENEKIAEKCQQAANLFREEAQCAFKMNEPKGGFIQNEQTTRKFADPEVRKQIVDLIYEAKGYDAKACELFKEIVSEL